MYLPQTRWWQAVYNTVGLLIMEVHSGDGLGTEVFSRRIYNVRRRMSTRSLPGVQVKGSPRIQNNNYPAIRMSTTVVALQVPTTPRSNLLSPSESP
jgi:hypothetical protein